MPDVGKRVLVAGCAVSALEIAAELAQLGAARVVVTQRRQRYVLPKFAAGVPSDHRIFTRYGVLAAEALPAAEVDRQLKEIVVEAGGSPEQYGAPAPDPSLFAAGVTLSQQYLPLVAEGRITVRPWMTSVAGTTVTFVDGHAEEFDGIVFGTGFDLEPAVPERGHSGDSSTSMRFTWTPTATPSTPTCPGWPSSGCGISPAATSCRWNCRPGGSPTRGAGRSRRRVRPTSGGAIDAYRSRRGMSQKTRMNLAALTFARAAGVEPHLENWPRSAPRPAVRPAGTELLPARGARRSSRRAARFARDAAAFGAITSNEFTDREQNYWSMVRNADVSHDETV